MWAINLVGASGQKGTHSLVFSLNANGRISYANSHLGQISGIPTSKLIGINWNRIFTREGEGTLESILENAASSDLPVVVKLRLNNSNKSPSFEAFVVRLDSDDFTVIAVSSRREAPVLPLRILHSPHPSNEVKVLSRILDQVEDGAIFLYAEGGCLINASARNLLNLPKEGFDEKNQSRIELHKWLPEELKSRLFPGLNKAEPEFEFQIPQPGNDKPAAVVRCRIIWINENNQSGRGDAYILMRDVAKEKESEAKIQELNEQLARMNRDLQQFAQIASHDLKEPLRAVSIYTTMLSRRYSGQLGKDADDYIQFAVGGACRMTQLIDDFLAYSRVGRTREFGLHAARDLINQAMEHLRRSGVKDEIDLQISELPDVWGDECELVQVFYNLFANAVKFRGEGVAEIRISAESRDDRWTFQIRDNGIGIPEEFQERIFLIFQRLHRQEEYPGTGIGLSICKKIVQEHGGEIWVESKEGAGSAFFFTLPTVPPSIVADFFTNPAER